MGGTHGQDWMVCRPRKDGALRVLSTELIFFKCSSDVLCRQGDGSGSWRDDSNLGKAAPGDSKAGKTG